MITPSSSLELSHFPVMLEKVIQICAPKRGETFVDCTFGGGGYSSKLLQFPGTKIVAFDRDSFIERIAKNLKDKYPKRFTFYPKKFSQISNILDHQSVDNIIFDLGLSSIQLNNLKRGFSFKSKDKLDMSMGLTNISAEDVVNNCSEAKLKLIIKVLGEEKDANIIAKNIVKARSNQRISKVDELSKIIENSKKKNFSQKNKSLYQNFPSNKDICK